MPRAILAAPYSADPGVALETIPNATQGALSSSGGSGAKRLSPWSGLLVAVWLAWLLGTLEAVEHAWFRFNPVILATFKTNLSVFWIAPLVDFAVFVPMWLIGCAVFLLYRRFPVAEFTAFGATWLGMYGILSLTKKIHYFGAAIFALGCAVAVVRALRAKPALWQVMRRFAAVPLALTLLAALVLNASAYWRERSALAALPPAAAGAPNVLFIVLDTVRADHMSANGYPRDTTPFIRELGQRGVAFDNAWSTTSWTFPSHASMFTGRPAYEHHADRDRNFDSRLPVLSEFFASRGYATGGFAGNIIWLIPECGFDRGFSHWEALKPWRVAARTSWGRKIHAQLTYHYNQTQLDPRFDAPKINQAFLEWLDAREGRPFYAFLNYFDAHDPYWPVPEYEKLYAGQTPPSLLPEQKEYVKDINRYDAQIRYIDDHLRQLFAELERRAKLQNTIVVITADHGDSLGDHHEPQHGDTLYQEVSRVHLLVIDPRRLPAGAHSPAAASVQQIPATLADLMDAADSPFPGVSLRKTLQAGAAQPPDDVVLAELQWMGAVPAMKSLISKDWQFIWNIKKKKPELFHLADDPRQLKDLAGAPEQRELIARRIEQLRAIFPHLGLPPAQTARQR